MVTFIYEVTYMVGGLCAINAIAGAYSDDLPVLIVSGGPNSHDKAKHRLVHHTIGEHDFYQASRCFEPVVAKVLNIRDVCEAQGKYRNINSFWIILIVVYLYREN